MMTLSEIAEIATPYDPIYKKETFLKLLHNNQKFSDSFNEQLTTEFEEEIKKKGVKFILNNVSWKACNIKPSIRVDYCGKEAIPTISVDY